MIILRLLLNILLMCKIINLAISSFYMPTHKKCDTSSYFYPKIGVGDQKCNKGQNRGTKMFDLKIGGPKSQTL
jgi:hypothetical protein